MSIFMQILRGQYQQKFGPLHAELPQAFQNKGQLNFTSLGHDYNGVVV